MNHLACSPRALGAVPKSLFKKREGIRSESSGRRLVRRIFAAAALVFLTGSVGAQAYTPPANNRVDLNFNQDWKFIKSDVPAASAATFDDSAWTAVSLPHTWNDDHFREWVGGNDAKADPMRPSGGYFGKAWYRKHFTIPSTYAGKKVILEFQGIGRMGKFWVNGTLVGTHENGIGPGGIDITNFVTFGSDNVIAVRVDNNQNDTSEEYGIVHQFDPNTGAQLADGPVKFPYGVPFNVNFGGINRDVTMHITDKLYQTFPLYRNLGTVGTYVYAKPATINTLARTADLTIDTEVKNDSGVSKTATLEAAVVDETGAVAYSFPASTAQTIANGATFHFVATQSLTGVKFWSPDYPYLYQVYTILKVGGVAVDVEKTNFGFRKFTFSRTFGLQVNGHPIFLNGYAPRSTMEWPAVGMPPDWMTEYDFKLMRADNGNFIRPMHGAPRKAQVDAADKFGIIMASPAVSTENDPAIVYPADQVQWQMKLDIMRDVTIYFRNDPSVLFWEGCNGALGAAHAQDMLDIRTQWDPWGGRLSGSRTNDDTTQFIREYSSTMDGAENNLYTPLWDAEYGRAEGPRRVWDVDSPMLNPKWDGVTANTITTPTAGTAANPGNPAAKYLKGGYFYIAGKYHQDLGLNSSDADEIGDYLNPINHAYFRLNSSEDMMLENLAKYWGRYVRSVFQQPAAINDSKGVMVGGAKIIWADSDTDGRMKDTEVARTSGAVDGVRIPKETFYGMQVAQADPTSNPMVYIAAHWNYPPGTVRSAMYVVSNLPRVKLITYNTSGTQITDYGDGVTNFFPAGVGGDQINHFVFKFSNVAWQPGSVKAIAYTNSPTEAGAVSQTVTTAGAPAKLRITQVAGPAPWKADGTDIAIFDVEVLDANNQRCPTYEDKVNFTWSGQGTFLGGYNSGRRYSNKLPDDPATTYALNIEAGINRVFVRANRTAGTFTVNVSGTGLTSASATATSNAVSVTNGLSTDFPQTYDGSAFISTLTEPAPVAEGVAPPPPSNAPNPASSDAFTDLHYTGAHSEEATVLHNIQGGEVAYKDSTTIHLPTTLPRYLIGADYIQSFKSDGGETSGTDQYQFDLNKFSYVYQVIDAANGMPNHNDNSKYNWVKLPETITVNGRTMKIYKSRLMQPYENLYLACNGKENNLSGFDSSLGFDPNSNMYLLFTVPAEQELQLPTNTVSATDSQGTNTPEKAIDANPATRWNAASSGTKVFNLDLGRNVLVGSYKINWQSSDTKYTQYLVEISPDNVNWQTSLDLTANVTTGENEYRIPATGQFAGRYIRITVSFVSGGGWPAIVDMKVYGVLNAAAASAVPTITSALTASNNAGYAVSYTIAASGSPTGYAVQGLPDGWTLNGNTGVISGITLDSGSFPITISGINTGGAGSAVLNFSIAPPPPIPVITSSLSYSTQAGVAIPTASAYVIAASNMTFTPSSFGASLPNGLGLAVSTSTGKITGTPKWPGTYPIDIRATNPGGTGDATLNFTVTANGPAPVISSAATVSGTAGVALTSYTITASNTPTLYDATPLAPGLARSTSTGIISGTPTTPGTYVTTISATGMGGTGTKAVTFNIAVNPNAPAINSALTASGNVGQPFSYTIGATNTPISYAATPLPAGLTMNATTGVISGTPTSGALGTTSTIIKATNASGFDQKTLVITIAQVVNPPVVSAPAHAVASVGSPFSFQIVGSNTPTSYSATGLTGSGLSVNATTGVISGSPTTAGTYTVTLGATNSGGTGNKTLSLVISAAGADINLALNQPVTDSSEHSATNVGSKAVDGDATGTRWESDYSDSQWIYVDLGSAHTIHSIGITWDNAAGKNYNLQGTNNPSGTWTDLVTPIVGNTVGGVANPLTYTVTGNPSYRYVRMYGTLRKMTAYGYSIYEFQVMGPASAGTPSAPVINSATTATGTVGTAFSYQITATNSPTGYGLTGTLPAGLSFNSTTGVISGTPSAAATTSHTMSATNGVGTGTASLGITIGATGVDTNISQGVAAVSASSVQAGNDIAKGNDGSTTTRWAASDGTFPQWWMVDLGANKTLSKIDIAWYSTATRYYKYKVEVSTDGTNFGTPVVDKTSNTTFGDTSDPFTATARYVRVTLTGASAGFGSAYEFKVYGH